MMGQSMKTEGIPPHPCPLSPQARPGELATLDLRIRERMRMGRGERPLSGLSQTPLSPGGRGAGGEGASL